MVLKSIVLPDLHDKKHLDFWDQYLLPIGLPLLLGLVLGPVLAALIGSEDWILALAMVFLMPLTILVIRYPFAGVMIWLLVMPWFPFDDTYKYVFFVAHRVLIPLALGITLLSRMLRLKKQAPVQLGPADLAMIAFGAIGIVSVFVTGNHWKLIFTVHDKFLVPFMAYWLIRFSDSHKQSLKRLILLMLLVGLSECVIGLISWFAPRSLPEIWRTGLVGARVVGTLRQPGAYACLLIFFSVPLYHLAMIRKEVLIRTFLLLAFSLAMVCVFFTFTRSAWLAGMLTLLGLLCLYPKTTALLAAAVMSVMLILSTGPLANEFAYASDRLEESREAAYERSIQANAGKNMFYARPVFGWGFGNYDRYDWKFMERTQNMAPTAYHVRKSTSHNTYLTILAEMGGVGFFLFYFPVIWWLGLTIKALPRLPKKGFWNRRLLIAMWLPIGAQVAVSQSIDMRFFVYVLTLFWINLGLIANIVQTSLKPGDSGGQGVT
jgi:O-antigen ligase